MTPEELDEARAKEAVRQFGEPADRHILAADRELARIAARLAREGWKPPEPVDPDVLAFREWAAERWPALADDYKAGSCDRGLDAEAYLAGARMATERERERAKVLVEYVQDDAMRPDCVGIRALNTIAKYEEGLK